jgi:hypothetical protein
MAYFSVEMKAVLTVLFVRLRVDESDLFGVSVSSI